ncbi:amiloride-sensitive sodium channel subunit beta-like [Stegodyphus dumicola]|uniref:amiloride-sensitive sodium channel subunit beta-like n=1 Tax=Stegodyphus dumicola TaxID=202533 RepID=UPI0015B1282E|nr:amiloride-sensitive sodium channel subunit beta-like [Stegodyphus dumicola]
MNKRRCFCANEDAYKGWRSRPFPDDTSYLDDINDTDVRNVIELIRGAKTDDLADIEEGLLPTPDDLFDYGVNFDSLIIACSFEQQPCYRENFTVLYHPKYGRCYMFNFLGNGQDSGVPIEIFSYGSTSGLHLTLHITSQQKVDLLSEEIGARVVIHDPYDLPFVAEHGFNVRPHDMSAVEVTLSRIERLGPPWGSCVQDGSYLDFKQNVKPYSILGCQKACRHFYMTKYCGCTLRHFLRGAVLLKSTTSFAFCSVTNHTQNLCMKDVIKRIQGKSIFCNCKPSCSELKYSTKVSSSKLNENFYRTVKSIRTLSNCNEGEIKMINASDRNSLVGLKVYYSTFQVGKDSEIASYSWETLVANVGGNLGFFMGLTLITFIEVLEFLWDMLCMIFKKLTKLNYYENKVLTFPSPS